MGLDSTVKKEDLHLLYYTPEQKAAEAKLDLDFAVLPPIIKVLVVIPFRDKWDMTDTCLQGLLRQQRAGMSILLALVDNNSAEPATQDGINNAKQIFESQGIEVRHLRYEVPFNFSYLNNQAVIDCADFNPDVIGLLNNDIEFMDPNSLMQLTQYSCLPDAGAVGCTLLYPNGLVQHLFIFVGSKIVGSHPYKGQPLDRESKWYQKPRAVGAVTGAVMFMKTSHFDKVGGFDEKLPTSYQDVDLCLKLQKIGLVNFVVPQVLMIHHETQTRSIEPSWNEAEYVEKKWGDFLFKNPYVSPVWSRKSEHFVFTPAAFFRSVRKRFF
ncbi:MAG: hypothetical protein H7249_10920 [Chitinophagaceae bacterium]|nr:hypothetical protein [Oligoflexus sp.]